MHVGYVVKRFPRLSETFIAQEILELERLGVEVTVFALRPNDRPAGHGWLERLAAPIVPCHGLSLSAAWRRLHRRARAHPADRRLAHEVLSDAFSFPSSRGKRCLCAAILIAEEIGRRGIDHLHAHFANQPAFVAYLAHRLTAVSYSFTGHAKDLYADALPVQLLRRLVACSAFTVTVSDDNRRHLLETLGASAVQKVTRIYNGVEVPELDVERTPTSAPRILCVARLVEKKGLETLVSAIAHLPDAVRTLASLQLRIVGDGPLRTPLRHRAHELGVASRIEWLGQLPHEKVLEEMCRSTVFVLPCRIATNGDRDALPTVLLEAMAQGAPCVSTRVGGVPEIIDHGVTGLLVRPQDPAALAEAITEVLCSPQRAREMGIAGRDRARRLFERRTNVARLLHRFERACRAAPSAPDRSLSEVLR